MRKKISRNKRTSLEGSASNAFQYFGQDLRSTSMYVYTLTPETYL